MSMTPQEAIREDQIIINHESSNEVQRKSEFQRRLERLIIEAQQQTKQEILEEMPSQESLNIKFRPQQIYKSPKVIRSLKSKFIKTENSEPQKIPEKKRYRECQICFADFEQSKLLSISSCRHKYCSQCLKGHLKNQIRMNKMAFCPDIDCNHKIDALSPFLKKLTPIEQQRYYNIQVYNNLLENQTIKICPSQNCEGFINLKQKPIICPICEKCFCEKCLFPQHKGLCDENAGLFLQDHYNFRKCQNCKMVLQKNKGCDHMTCKCGHQFCYLCGKAWADRHKCNQSSTLTVIHQNQGNCSQRIYENPPTPPLSPLCIPISYSRASRINQLLNTGFYLDTPTIPSPRLQRANTVMRKKQPNNPINIRIPNNNIQRPVERMICNIQAQQNRPQRNNKCCSSLQRGLKCLIFYSIRVIAFIFLIVFLYSLYLPTFSILLIAYRLRSGCVQFATYSWKYQIFFNIFLYMYCIVVRIPYDWQHQEECFGIFTDCLRKVFETPLKWISLSRSQI